MTTQSPAGPGGYLVKDFADGWYWTPNAALDHASGALVWSVADGRYETDPPVILIVAEEPQAAEDVHRTMDGETVGGFRVAAWRYIGPQDPDDARYGYRYCEHWSSVGNVPKKVERLFTEEQLRAAMLSAAPAPEGGAVMKACADFQEAIDDFEAEVADVMAEGSERADLWDREIMVNIDALKTVMSAALATREEAPASEGEREPLCMAYKTGYAEGVEDSNGMFDRESCEEGWGQYAEKLSAQPALPARLPLPTVDDGRGGRRPINPQDDR